MADFTQGILNALNKGAAAVSTAAGNLADSAKNKAEELTASARKTELIRALGEKVYSLYQQGTALPEELQQMLEELTSLEPKLQHQPREAEKTIDAQPAEEQAPAEEEEIPAPKEEEKKPEKKPTHRAWGWGIQPSSPVPTMVVKDEPVPAKAPEAPKEQPTVEISRQSGVHSMPSLSVDDVYTADTEDSAETAEQEASTEDAAPAEGNPQE